MALRIALFAAITAALAVPTAATAGGRATVVFPSAGTWKMVVDDGFAARHSFPAVEVRGGGEDATEPVALANPAAATPPSPGDDGPNLLLAFAAAAIAAVAAGLGAAFLQRRLGRPGSAAR